MNQNQNQAGKVPKIVVKAVKVEAGDANCEYLTVRGENAAIAGYRASTLCNKIDVTLVFQDDRYARITLYPSDQPDIEAKFLSTQKSVRARLSAGFGGTDFEKRWEEGCKVLESDLITFFEKYSLDEPAADGDLFGSGENPDPRVITEDGVIKSASPFSSEKEAAIAAKEFLGPKSKQGICFVIRETAPGAFDWLNMGSRAARATAISQRKLSTGVEA
ncbi:hypothetical protein C2L64_45450 [Paraburkholderia hospita]|uniref:Uncharacterized protein n=1 Tax=Paraburkholderia hospita TaxID=169430 RepID=A0AAN1MQQ2_9BURK|nr:hypothetical protein [Paraburkholderia hospita]AUT75611.1 hypothetical protein C2L64_45450 [Paraburkholderia hospita]